MLDKFEGNRIKEFLAYHIFRPHHGGHGIHSPFQFEFVNMVVYTKHHNDEASKQILQLYKKLLKSSEIIEIEDLGVGSHTMPVKNRREGEIARKSSTLPKYGKWMKRLVEYLKPKIIIELGTCLGIGTAWMASGNLSAYVYTIEGSKNLQQKALKHFEQLGLQNITSYQGNFNVHLPVILSQGGTFDLLFIDGNHQKEATLSYFEQAIPYINEKSVIIFDDIRWSEGMFEAWREICSSERVTLSLDFFRLGVIFFNPKLKKEHFTLHY